MSPILKGVIASGITGHLNTWAPTSAYDALSTIVVPSGGLSSITFAGIPQTGYTHLQIRFLHGTNPGGYDSGIRFNDDSNNNYWGHYIYGTNSTAGSGNLGSKSFMSASFSGTSNTKFSPSVVDILDYASRSKNKTIRSLTGRNDANGTGDVYLMSGSWTNTSAINSITIVAPSATFIENSSFALYGVK